MDRRIQPQKLVLVTKPPTGEWSWEIKFDGYRMMARIEQRDVTLITKNGHDWTSKFPQLANELSKIPVDCYLDGELVYQDEAGRPDFHLLTSAVASGDTGKLILVLFDMMYIQGHDIRNDPLEYRREVLESMLNQLDLDLVRFSATFDQPAASLLASACTMKLEGLVGKKKGSRYTSSRNGDWVKLKCNNRQEFAVGGYTISSCRKDTLSSLLVGYYDRAGSFHYAGSVGSGLTLRMASSLRNKLLGSETQSSPFINPPKSRSTEMIWVKPCFVCEVSFSEITPTGKIRHGVFIGLRDDIPASDVTLEA